MEYAKGSDTDNVRALVILVSSSGIRYDLAKRSFTNVGLPRKSILYTRYNGHTNT
jgi:hypothetical protein